MEPLGIPTLVINYVGLETITLSLKAPELWEWSDLNLYTLCPIPG